MENKHSILKTECAKLAKASYQCLEQNAENSAELCKQFFDEYKACRKAEHTKLIDDRRKNGEYMK